LARTTGGAARSARPLGKPAVDSAALRAAAEQRITPPTAMVFVDVDQWNARADALGGTSNALLVGLAARMAQRVGRTAADGSVVVAMPINERAPGDTRANAVSNVDIVIPAAAVTTDLRGIRALIKHALIRHRNTPDLQWAMLPLIPLVPRWLAKRAASVAAGPPNCVVATYLGAIDPAATRPDGTVADYFAMQSLFPGVTRATAHRAGGRLALGAGIAHGRVFVSAMAYQPDRPNSNDKLRQDLSRVLSDFSLTCTARWGGASHVDAAA
jgi:diacylglycerol O-acyltransferase / wax synthase